MKNLTLFLALFLMSFDFNKKNHLNKRTNSTSENIKIQGAVGQLSAVLQVPQHDSVSKVPLVILMHGIFDQKESVLIRTVADELERLGIASIRFDFMAHGASEGQFIDMTIEKEITDARAVFNYARSLDDFSDISLLGHSQGGVVAALLASELKGQVKSLVLLAPAGVMEFDSRQGKMLGATFDPKNPPEYITLYGSRVGREYLLSTQNLGIYEKSAAYLGPVCLVHGKMDNIVSYTYSEKYDSIYQNSTLHILQQADHMFYRSGMDAVKIATSFLSK